LRNKSERNPAAYIYSHGFSENNHFPEGEEVFQSLIIIYFFVVHLFMILNILEV